MFPAPPIFRRWLLAWAGVLTALGVGVEVAHSALGARTLEPLVAFLSLSYEQNLPTWYASGLLLGCALVLAGIGRAAMELPLGWWTEQHGSDNLVYALIDHVEEALELVGASLFLAALVEELGERVALTAREEAAHGPGPTASR